MKPSGKYPPGISLLTVALALQGLGLLFTILRVLSGNPPGTVWIVSIIAVTLATITIAVWDTVRYRAKTGGQAPRYKRTDHSVEQKP